jgi:signal transduction histidine kinase
LVTKDRLPGHDNPAPDGVRGMSKACRKAGLTPLFDLDLSYRARATADGPSSMAHEWHCSAPSTLLLRRTRVPTSRQELNWISKSISLANADANQLEMAVLNLCHNARDAMPDGCTIAVRLAGETIASGHCSKLPFGSNYLYLPIEDTGSGMDEATMARALEPFFSTKEIRKGRGLGMSIVEGLMFQLGGALALRSKLESGTTVEIWLPASAELIKAARLWLNLPHSISSLRCGIESVIGA